MTLDEARQVFLSRGYVEVEGGTIYDPDKWREACRVISEWLEQQDPSSDIISRQAVMDALCDGCELFKNGEQTCRSKCEEYHFLATLPPVTPQTKWTPVSERLPEDLEPVNITWINHDPESYYANIKDKPFTATGIYFKGQWYWWSTLCADILAEYSHNYDDVIDDDIEIIAWQPLPQPYRAESEVPE